MRQTTFLINFQNSIKMKTIKKIVPVLGLLILVSCGQETAPIDANEENASTEGTKTIVTNAQFALGKMNFGKLTKQQFEFSVKANGMLDVPPENKSTISAYFGGYVKNISLLQGQKIAKGQVLFTLESPDYIQVQQDYLEAKSLLSYLKSDYERQKELAATNVSSQKTYLKSESEYKMTLARFESLKKKLQLMNINPNGITEYNMVSTISVRAPISGYVTSVLATKGMFLNPSDIALTIMNVDHMHIELSIFEQDLPRVAIDQNVTFRIENNNTAYKATVFLINKAIDPVKRTIKIHCHFNDEKEALSLMPGMFVEAEIAAASDSSFALPIEAVVAIENKSYILLKKKQSKGNYEFEKVEVKIGETTKKYVEILNPSDKVLNGEVLIEGAFNLIKE